MSTLDLIAQLIAQRPIVGLLCLGSIVFTIILTFELYRTVFEREQWSAEYAQLIARKGWGTTPEADYRGYLVMTAFMAVFSWAVMLSCIYWLRLEVA